MHFILSERDAAADLLRAANSGKNIPRGVLVTSNFAERSDIDILTWTFIDSVIADFAYSDMSQGSQFTLSYAQVQANRAFVAQPEDIMAGDVFIINKMKSK